MGQLIWYIVSMLVSYYISSQMLDKQRGNPLGAKDVDVPQIDEGTPQTVLHGDGWTSGWTVLGWGGVSNQGVKENGQVLYYIYSMDILMGLWRGPVDGIRGIMANSVYLWSGEINSSDRIVIVAPNAFGGYTQQGGVDGTLRIAMGEPDQLPISGSETIFGHALPAFRGRVTGFFSGQIAANSLSPYPWSIRGHRTLAGWARGEAWYPETCEILLRNDHDNFALDNRNNGAGGDPVGALARTIHAKNGVHILYEAYTDPLWGKGKDESLLDDARWASAAETCFDEQLGLCVNWSISDDVDGFIQKICDHIGCGIYTSILTGKIAIRMFRNDYDPDALPTFSPGAGLLSIDSIDETSLSEAVSEIIVQWRDPVTNQPRSTRQQNLGLLQSAPIVSKTSDYPYLPTIELANRVASRDLMAQGLGIRRYTLTLDRSGASREPGDLMAISSPEHGIVRDILRIVNIDYGSSEAGHVKITAAQDVFGLPSSTYALPQGSVWSPPPQLPGVISDYRLFEGNYRDLVLAQGQATVDSLPEGSSSITSVAIPPTTACTRYAIASRRGNETGYLFSKDSGTFTPRGVVSADTETLNAVAVTVGGVSMGTVQPGSLALWDNEIVQIVSISDQTLTLRRGCIDAVPTTHAAGSYLWFYEDQTGDIDRTFIQGDAVDVLMLAYVGSTSIDPTLETPHPFTVTGRLQRPYPPRQVTVAGAGFGEGKLVSSDDTLTWVESNRVTQGAAVYSQEDDGLAAEAGTTYSVTITDDLGTTLLDATDLTATEVALPVGASGLSQWTIQLGCQRNGVASLQTHSFTVTYARDVRLTSTGRARGTSQGGVRVVTH